MTASVTTPRTASVNRGTGLRVTQLRVVRSEWTKFRSASSCSSSTATARRRRR